MTRINIARFRMVVSFCAVVFLATFAFGKDNNVTLHGSIEDSQCAYNVHSAGHSHDWMINKKVEGASDPRSCTNHCVRDMGGNYVLVVKNEVYRLSDQDLAGKFAGDKVKISGVLDPASHTIHHFTIEQEK
jgi:hypothetical protein